MGLDMPALRRRSISIRDTMPMHFGNSACNIKSGDYPVTDWLKLNWHIVAIVVLLLVATNQCTSAFNQKEIIRVEKEKLLSDIAKQELERKAADITRQQNVLQEKIIAAEQEIGTLKRDVAAKQQQIVELEAARKLNVLNVRELDTTDQLESAFAETFPSIMRIAGTGIVEQDVDGILRDYMVLPAWTIETFLIQHGNLEAAEGKVLLYDRIVEQFGTIDQIREKVVGLEREKFGLEQVRANAYRDGYESCNVRYEGVVDRYISQLEKPRFELPGGAKMLGCAAIGVGAAVGLSKVW
jgi:hypothetical protein